MSLRVRKVDMVSRIAATLLAISTANPVLAAPAAAPAPEIPKILKKGYDQLRKTDYRGAILTFREAVKQNSNDPLARRCLAYALRSSMYRQTDLESVRICDMGIRIV